MPSGFYDLYSMIMGWWSNPPDAPPVLRTSHGRQGIGVAQPQSGIDFPLVSPSEDVRYLLADFNISFDQPSDYADVAEFKLPFRIYWMYGFGATEPDFPIPQLGENSSWSSLCVPTSESVGSNSSVVSTECLPRPAHAHDIIVVDADDRVVFDSTASGVTYETRPWGDRLQIIVWRHPTEQIVSMVIHTAWNENDEPVYRDYLSYFFPEDAVLDARTIDRLPKRVRSLQVVLDNLRKTAVDFVAGYNMQIDAGETEEIDGRRRVTRVTFNATPGAGLGVFPDCTPEPLQIKQINGVRPTTSGDFFLAATGCYWVRQPTRVISTNPLVTAPQVTLSPGNILTAGLPDEDAGTTKSALGWPPSDDPRYAHLQLGNDCGPCCDCPDYVSTAEFMNDVRDQYHAVGKILEGTRDLYHINRERWLAAADCMNRKPLRLRMLPQFCPFLDVSVQFCNQTGNCLNALELTVTFSTSPGGGTAIQVPGFGFITGGTNIPGRTAPATDRYQMAGSWPTFSAYFDSVPAGQSANARFRLQFDDCGMTAGVAYAVTGSLTGTVNGDPIMVNNTDDPPVQVEAEVTDTRTLNCPAVDTALNLLVCACEQ